MESGLVASQTAGQIPVAQAKPARNYWTLSRLKRGYVDYLSAKQEEITEQQDARRYYHGSQWTDSEIKALRKRKQPVVTYNRMARKLNSLVGLIEKTKTDPKAYARTPKHEQGAELATAVMRYATDQNDWSTKRAESVLTAAIDGLSGIELTIEQGDHGDPEIGIEMVEPEGFFYDPRSVKADFSDAMYMGVGKWVDVELAKVTFPDHADLIDTIGTDASELTSNSDRDTRWVSSDGGVKRIRLCDIWYRHEGTWCWAIFVGSNILQEGETMFRDEKNRPLCKFIMWSANVDHDGDRYGFIRNMKSAQDELNHRRSKGLHILNSRRLVMTAGAVDDVEIARREWAKPDGVVLINGSNVNEAVKVDDQSADLAGQLKFLEDAKAEIENFGFNPALIGQGVQDMSGRAINLQQQAGIAELGRFLSLYRGWTIRVYRALFSAIQDHWQSERWVRVTDDEQVAQYIQINGIGIDPATGMPTLVNALGSLDVDIILDEGPDTINMMADAYDTLQVLASKGAQMPPQLLIELSPLPSSVKSKMKDILEQAAQQPDQQAAAAMQAEQAKMQMQMQIEEMKAKAGLQAKQAELALKAQSEQTSAHIDVERNRVSAEIERQKAEDAYNLKLMELRAELQMKQEEAELNDDRERKKIEYHGKIMEQRHKETE